MTTLYWSGTIERTNQLIDLRTTQPQSRLSAGRLIKEVFWSPVEVQQTAPCALEMS